MSAEAGGGRGFTLIPEQKQKRHPVAHPGFS